MYSVEGWLFKSPSSVKFVSESRCHKCIDFPWNILVTDELFNKLIDDFGIESEIISKYSSRFKIDIEENRLEKWFEDVSRSRSYLTTISSTDSSEGFAII